MPTQDEVIAFLSDPASYDPPPASVDRIETHGAFVFLAGEAALKIKRAVSYDYMDFSTLARRRQALLREFEINAPNAPGLYLAVTAITREAPGRLAFDGQGEAVEYALHMHRFEQSALLSEMAAAGPLSFAVVRQVADAVFAYHASAARHPEADGVEPLSRVISELDAAFARNRTIFSANQRQAFRERAGMLLAGTGDLLRSRAAAGNVRRCHGDLHLRNIVMQNGRPVMFDALEFSEELATIDTLYDLAFLLMDLDLAGQRPQANVILNRYLWLGDDIAGLDALRTLPLFLALRAAIRAMVAAQRAERVTNASRGADNLEARRYLKAAISYTAPPPPCLIAVGGFSGTGKSTLAATLAPIIGAAPGALHLRSDLERKSMFEASETDRLPPAAYTQEASDAVYARTLDKARIALAAGHAVIVDAVFAKPEERAAAEDIAMAAKVPFEGLWLTADREALIERVASRTGDASDATPEVVDQQLEHGAGPVGWQSVDAGGPAETTVTRARQALRAAGLIPC